MIGYYGAPPRKIIEEHIKKSGQRILDLDIDYGHKKVGWLPKTYCCIVKNIITNALFYKNELSLIICSVGEEKCDGGRFASVVLKSMGFPVIETRAEKTANIGKTPISDSGLPLRDKVLRIMGTVHSDKAYPLQSSEAVMGFWGVPPNDLGLLDLFPNETHVFGWTRSIEAKAPDNLDIECYVPDKLPTIFFTQSFCQKALIAKYLAAKYNGLFIDIDSKMNSSAEAKIEAFIKLRVK